MINGNDDDVPDALSIWSRSRGTTWKVGGRTVSVLPGK